MQFSGGLALARLVRSAGLKPDPIDGPAAVLFTDHRAQQILRYLRLVEKERRSFGRIAGVETRPRPTLQVPQPTGKTAADPPPKIDNATLLGEREIGLRNPALLAPPGRNPFPTPIAREIPALLAVLSLG